jgi:Zinc knuckle
VPALSLSKIFQKKKKNFDNQQTFSKQLWFISFLLSFMGRQSAIAQEQRSQSHPHQGYKVTKTMAPTRNTYSLRSKVAESEALDGIEVRPKTKAITNTSQPLITALTLQVAQLSTALEEQRAEFTRQLSTALEEQRAVFTRQYEALQTELLNFKADISTAISTQLSNAYVPAPAHTTRISYATAAQLPPSQRTTSLSQQRNLASNSASRAAIMADTPYCTIDTSGVGEDKQQDVQPGAIRAVIEKEIRTTEGNHWRCAAVMRDPRNTARIRVACRDEKEQQAVKQAVEKAKVQGTRVLRDQLFPIKVDGVCRCAVLDEHSQLRPEIAQKLGKENEVEIAKLAWLSKKDNLKAYGSMVIYLTKASYATTLLQDQFFHVNGESGWTSVFKPFSGPTQCYNCQQIGHKAFNCKKTQVCGKCAREGHHHKDCIDNTTPKCVPCGGPHESFSRSCRVLYPRNE